MQGCRRLWEGRNQKRHHATDRRELDKGLTALWQPLVIARETTPAGDPGDGSLHDPATLPPDAVFWFWVFAMVFSFPDLLV